MDNITHTVAGLAIGELIQRSLSEEANEQAQKTRHRLLLVAASVASNFPDIDLVLTPLLPPPLGYLLHHRGHTHTILYALPQAILMFAAIWFLWTSARTLLKESAIARRGFGVAILTGFALHMLMDYLNSYGIHPFHPFDSRWFFGDMVFIIEPVFWVACGMPMAALVERKWLRWFYYAFLLGIPAAFAAFDFLPRFATVALFAMGWALVKLQKRDGAKGTTALVLSAFLCFVFVAGQSYASGIAKRTALEILKKKDPDSKVLDTSMSSFPTNPLCWMIVSVEAKEKENTYRLRRGIISISKLFSPAHACPKGLSQNEKSLDHSYEHIFYSEDLGDLALLRKLKSENCHVESWLRFSRAPLADEKEIKDVRFRAAGPRGNFTLMRYSDLESHSCDQMIPKWDFPRRDLLGE